MGRRDAIARVGCENCRSEGRRSGQEYRTKLVVERSSCGLNDRSRQFSEGSTMTSWSNRNQAWEPAVLCSIVHPPDRGAQAIRSVCFSPNRGPNICTPLSMNGSCAALVVDSWASRKGGSERPMKSDLLFAERMGGKDCLEVNKRRPVKEREIGEGQRNREG